MTQKLVYTFTRKRRKNITYDVPRLATTIQGERIIKLIPMCEAEFETFMEISMRNQSQDQVKAGKWKAEEADTNI